MNKLLGESEYLCSRNNCAVTVIIASIYTIKVELPRKQDQGRCRVDVVRGISASNLMAALERLNNFI